LVITGHLKRLIIEIPPRHGKSTLVSKFFACTYLGYHPEREIILTSYNNDKAAEWGGACRKILDKFGPQLFGVWPIGQASEKWKTNLGAQGPDSWAMRTAGPGGSITGGGMHLGIIDDPVKDREEALSPVIRDNVWDWFTSTFYTRENLAATFREEAAIVIILTRWHRDDLVGRIKRQMAQGGERWAVVTMPAIADPGCMDDPTLIREGNPHGFRYAGDPLWPEMRNFAALERIKRQLTIEHGTMWWNALYQQNPESEGSSDFNPGWFTPDLWVPRWPDEATTEWSFKVLALDPSLGIDNESRPGDYCAFVRLGGVGVEGPGTGKLYVSAKMRNSGGTEHIASDLRQELIEFKPDVFVLETNGFQRLLKRDVMEAMGAVPDCACNICGVNNDVNKRTRILRLGGKLAAKMFNFVDGPGTRLLWNQLQEHPNGAHDDGPDALEMAYRGAVRYFNATEQADDLGERFPVAMLNRL